jgi:hypothetical protein
MLSGKQKRDEPTVTLEQFLSESIRVCREHGYPPTTFERMWNDARRQGSPVEEVIAFLVETSEPRSGYKRVVSLNIAQWSLEQAVLNYPQRFRAKTRAYAQARRDGTLDA